MLNIYHLDEMLMYLYHWNDREMFEEYLIDLVSKGEQFDPLNQMQNDRICNEQINTIQVKDENDRLLYN